MPCQMHYKFGRLIILQEFNICKVFFLTILMVSSILDEKLFQETKLYNSKCKDKRASQNTQVI